MHLPLTQNPSLRDRPIGKTHQRKLRLTFYSVICVGNQAFKGRKQYQNKKANKTVFYKGMRLTIFSNVFKVVKEIFEPRIVKEKYSQTLAKGSKDILLCSLGEKIQQN